MCFKQVTMAYNIVSVSLTMLLTVAQSKHVVYSTKLSNEFAEKPI